MNRRYKKLKEHALMQTKSLCEQFNISNSEINNLIDILIDILDENSCSRSIDDIPKKPPNIIRCKDCGWAKLRDGYNDRLVCKRWNNTTGQNEFCSYGYK